MEKSIYLNAFIFVQLISARLADEKNEEGRQKKKMSQPVYNLVKL